MESRPIIEFGERLKLARKEFFEDQKPEVSLNHLVLNSWQRCRGRGLTHRDQLDFMTLNKSELKLALSQDQMLIQAFDAILSRYAHILGKTDYLAVLTNQHGIALAVYGDSTKQAKSAQIAFRVGVNFSEDAIGTNAMGCAISSGREVSILGGEHYVECITRFQCAAAPVFNQYGEVIGTIDLSRISSKPDFGSKQFVHQMARHVERQIFLAQDSAFAFEFNLLGDPLCPHRVSHPPLLMGFSQDGVLTSYCQQTNNMFDVNRMNCEMHFNDLFEETFADIVSVDSQNELQHFRLKSGLDLIGRTIKSRRATKVAFAAQESELPEFGEPSIHAHIRQAQRALAADLPIFIGGETGTGKDVIARLLYETAGLTGKLVALNCAAVPETLIESELFGYAEGAFTGARRGGAVGKIEEANQGVLFLDEIGDMPLSMQARLLRVIETGEVVRLGSHQSHRIRFKLISASHCDLKAAIKQGSFREDLYYRIKGFAIVLPPLRVRSRLKNLIQAMSNQILGEKPLEVSALEKLSAYPWPGNARELSHVLNHIKAFSSEEDLIVSEHLPDEILNSNTTTDVEGMPLCELEKNAIVAALKDRLGHVGRASRDLGLSQATLYRKVQEYRINLKQFRGV